MARRPDSNGRRCGQVASVLTYPKGPQIRFDGGMRNIDACLYVRPGDRVTLERLLANCKTPQKIVARARIVLLSGRGFGTNAIQREARVSKPTVWRWQQAYVDGGVERLLKDASGAVREGSALLQGLGSCGHCGRRLRTHYRGRSSAPGYHCAGDRLVEGRGSYCLNVGAIQIDEAVTRAFIAALEPAKLAATLAAAERLESDREATLKQWRLGVERASYEASRAERRYRAVDPDNRLVARGLEREWEESLGALEAARSELARHERERPRVLSKDERDRLLALGCDLATVWYAATTTPRDRKELLRALLEEVIIKVERDKAAAHLTLRWKGGAVGEIDLALPRSRPATIRTAEDTVALVRRLAVHYPDTVIAGILNTQGRTTARGHRFEGNRVGNLRRHWNIPCFEPGRPSTEGSWRRSKKPRSCSASPLRLLIWGERRLRARTAYCRLRVLQHQRSSRAPAAANGRGSNRLYLGERARAELASRPHGRRSLQRR